MQRLFSSFYHTHNKYINFYHLQNKSNLLFNVNQAQHNQFIINNSLQNLKQIYDLFNENKNEYNKDIRQNDKIQENFQSLYNLNQFLGEINQNGQKIQQLRQSFMNLLIDEFMIQNNSGIQLNKKKHEIYKLLVTSKVQEQEKRNMIKILLGNPLLELDSRKLINDYMFNEFQKDSDKKQQKNIKIFMFLTGLIVFQTVIFQVYRIYYYLEYEVDIKTPRVSDFHIYRFR